MSPTGTHQRESVDRLDTLASGISMAKQTIQRTSPVEAEIISALSGSTSAPSKMS